MWYYISRYDWGYKWVNHTKLAKALDALHERECSATLGMNKSPIAFAGFHGK
jgi:hypothetical protein